MRLLSSEAKTGNPEWLVKLNKCFAARQLNLHNAPQLKLWMKHFKLDGDKPKQNSETCINPTAHRYRL